VRQGEIPFAFFAGGCFLCAGFNRLGGGFDIVLRGIRIGGRRLCRLLLAVLCRRGSAGGCTVGAGGGLRRI
jgi:hypothetical protein